MRREDVGMAHITLPPAGQGAGSCANRGGEPMSECCMALLQTAGLHEEGLGRLFGRVEGLMAHDLVHVECVHGSFACGTFIYLLISIY